jgi:hypothetical protein
MTASSGLKMVNLPAQISCGRLHDLSKCLRIAHGDVRQHLAIQFDLGLLQARE